MPTPFRKPSKKARAARRRNKETRDDLWRKRNTIGCNYRKILELVEKTCGVMAYVEQYGLEGNVQDLAREWLDSLPNTIGSRERERLGQRFLLQL